MPYLGPLIFILFRQFHVIHIKWKNQLKITAKKKTKKGKKQLQLTNSYQARDAESQIFRQHTSEMRWATLRFKKTLYTIGFFDWTPQVDSIHSIRERGKNQEKDQQGENHPTVFYSLMRFRKVELKRAIDVAEQKPQFKIPPFPYPLLWNSKPHTEEEIYQSDKQLTLLLPTNPLNYLDLRLLPCFPFFLAWSECFLKALQNPQAETFGDGGSMAGETRPIL